MGILNVLPKTTEQFEKVLRKLRPKYKKLEVKINPGSAGLIYGDGKLLHVVEESGDGDMEEEINRMVEFYQDLPLLHPGCRGKLAKHLGVQINRDFNRWFDSHANRLTKKGE